MDKSYFSVGAGYMGVLGVSPLLARATTLITGVSMGLATLAVLIMTVASVSVCRRFIPYNVRLPVILIISVTWVTVLDLVLQACWFELRTVLGIYIPLLAVNSFILLSLEQTALTRPPARALTATLGPGLSVVGIVSLLGALRELLGQGTLLDDANLLFTTNLGHWQLFDGGVTLLHKTPGALLGLGLLLAAVRGRGAGEADDAGIGGRPDPLLLRSKP